MEVVRIKKILAQNLLIYIGLYCVRRSSWTVTTLATLIHIPNIYLGLGIEFGLQRIRDLAFLCPKSVAVRKVVAFPIVEKQQCAKQIAEKELEQNIVG